uniref:Heme-binding protein soul2 n=1 Tax=Stegastes partitus TaxID=144197 RepID=A0A3B5ACD3_9TELE
MEQPLVTLVALVLVAFCKGGTSTVDFCLNKSCPESKLLDKNEDFEVRWYAASEWITTKIDGDGTVAAMAANSRLQKSGYAFLSKSWPVLVTYTEGEDGLCWTLSWFVPKNTTKPENHDPSVTLQTKPAATVYVRLFSGTPSLAWGQENAKILQDALKKAEKTFNSSTYSGAAYDSYWSLHHHNEIWIPAE